MSDLEDRINAALRSLDREAHAGKTSIGDYRRRRRDLLDRLRRSIEATLDVTLRRPAPSSLENEGFRANPDLRDAISPLAIAAWIVLLSVLMLAGWLIFQLAQGASP